MELKPDEAFQSMSDPLGSNCTYMELKQDKLNAYRQSYKVLIAPIWN